MIYSKVHNKFKSLGNLIIGCAVVLLLTVLQLAMSSAQSPDERLKESIRMSDDAISQYQKVFPQLQAMLDSYWKRRDKVIAHLDKLDSPNPDNGEIPIKNPDHLKQLKNFREEVAELDLEVKEKETAYREKKEDVDNCREVLSERSKLYQVADESILRLENSCINALIPFVAGVSAETLEILQISSGLEPAEDFYNSQTIEGKIKSPGYLTLGPEDSKALPQPDTQTLRE